jgi:hypothetical protein
VSMGTAHLTSGYTPGYATAAGVEEVGEHVQRAGEADRGGERRHGAGGESEHPKRIIPSQMRRVGPHPQLHPNPR